MRISLLALVLLASACTVPPPAAPVVGDVVTVTQGTLRGTDDGSVVAFHAIPYAAPPVGDARWAAPRPAPAWSGERDATKPRHRCPQPNPAGGVIGAEDCLTLSVHAPSGHRADAKRPVLVWIHGGGFMLGGADETDPRDLVTEGDLIVVSVNYRLSALGFLSLPGLDGGGTFGLQDQQAALRWVRDTIATFGGDPGKVTLYGISAGGDSVCSHLAAPGSAGLFHRAILGSSACNKVNALDTLVPGLGSPADTWKSVDTVNGLGAAFAKQLGCADVACLRAKPAEAIAAASVYYWSPTIGTDVLPVRPAEAIAAGRAAQVPLIMGIVRDEGVSLVAGTYRPPLDATRFTTLLTRLAGPQAVAAYPLAGRSANRAFADVYGDRVFACANVTTYEALGERVWAYELAEPDLPAIRYTPPADMRGATPHAADQSLVFTLTEGQPALTGPQRELARRLREYWIAFITTGEPGWPRFHTGVVMTLRGTGPVVERRAAFEDRHHCAVWRS